MFFKSKEGKEKMKRLTKFIEKNISGKKVLVLFILTNVV